MDPLRDLHLSGLLNYFGIRNLAGVSRHAVSDAILGDLGDAVPHHIVKMPDATIRDSAESDGEVDGPIAAIRGMHPCPKCLSGFLVLAVPLPLVQRLGVLLHEPVTLRHVRFRECSMRISSAVSLCDIFVDLTQYSNVFPIPFVRVYLPTAVAQQGPRASDDELQCDVDGQGLHGHVVFCLLRSLRTGGHTHAHWCRHTSAFS